MRAILLILFLASGTASAQTEAPRRPSWLSVGVSSSAPPSRTGTGSDALVTAALDYHRPLGTRGLVLQAGGSASSTFFGSASLVEAHVAAATSVQGGPVQITLAVGPSVGHVDPVGRSEGRIVAGLYGRAEAVLVVVPPFGIGGHVFGHLNSGMTVIGAGMTLAFGRLSRALVPNPPPTPPRPGP